MSKSINLLIAQINPNVGDVQANGQKILQIITAQKHNHDLIVFPELALTGYQLEDLLFHNSLHIEINRALDKIKAAADNACHVIVGHPNKINAKIYNQLSVFANAECKYNYSKRKLPNYGIFDERRYYTRSNNKILSFKLQGQTIKICICEDLWQGTPQEIFGDSKTDLLISINSSPFEYAKQQLRYALCSKFAKNGVHVVYVNQVGGQDELIFDGASFAMDKSGKIAAQLPEFTEAQASICLTQSNIQGQYQPILTEHAATYQAIVLGLKDYVHKNNFTKVILGLSGGIDSALCLAIAVDALGSEQVQAVLLPSEYTAEISNQDAIQMANTLRVKYCKIKIADINNCMLKALKPLNHNPPKDLTCQNLQARIRGTLLMALSNDLGAMLLCTSNKSEAAVGYSTLYGDMNGGFAPIKDLYKTMVYELAAYRNSIQEIIPKRILTRAPSAELAPNQKDEDHLPKYSILDPILKYYIEENLDLDAIVAKGFPADTVKQIINLISNSEYKRRQAVLGPKVTRRAFGKDWRLPISKNFKIIE